MNSLTSVIFGQILFLIALFLFVGLGMWLIHIKKNAKDDKKDDTSWKD